MSRIAKYAVVAVVALGMCVVAQAQAGPGPRRHMGAMGPGSFAFERIVGGFGGKVVTGAPFTGTVTSETVQTLSDGTKLDQKANGTIARDSVGRTRTEMTFSHIGPLAASGEEAQIAFIRDPAAGKNYILNETRKTVLTIDRRAGSNEEGQWMGRGKDRGENANVQTTSLGSKTIDGLTVEGTQTTRTIPAGTIGNDKPIVITRVEWYSQDLQMVISSTHTDPRFGTTTYELTNINRSEPAQSMFTVPQDYTAARLRISMRPKVGEAPDSQ
ncbi:MAG TPA: hypothetical protein VKB26_15735 [Candidatus Acidoferrales bacterium]|nr:hypothetical protein [Candidatus Acidoferrales bacterium]